MRVKGFVHTYMAYAHMCLFHHVLWLCFPYKLIVLMNYTCNNIVHHFLIAIYYNSQLCFSFSDVHFRELQPLFCIDPYLLRYFVLKTDINFLSSILDKVPLSILIMRLTKDCIYTIKVCTYMDVLFKLIEIYVCVHM